jgi:hypothetical protein
MALYTCSYNKLILSEEVTKKLIEHGLQIFEKRKNEVIEK